MKRRLTLLTACLLMVLAGASPAAALEEPERLWMVGERAFADGLYPVAARALARLVAQYPREPRLPAAVLLLGKARLALGELEPALEAFRRAQTFTPAPGSSMETLLRLQRVAEARDAYDEVVRKDAASPHAPAALYGVAWAELELKRPEPAAAAFREFLQAWPDHALAASATLNQARALAELKRYGEVQALLEHFSTAFPGQKLVPDAQYLLGLARVMTGDARRGVADLRAFAAAFPSHAQAPAARRLITETLARHGDREEQAEAYKALMDQAPPTPEALFEAAAIGERLGRAREEEAAWRRLRKEFPDHPLGRRAALELAGAAFKRKEWKEASALAAAAAQAEEDAVRAEALLLAGEADLKLKKYAAAAKAFEGVGEVTGAEPAVHYRALAGLGLAREEQQEWRAALNAYEAVASKSPDASLREWAKQRAAVVKKRLKGGGSSNAPASSNGPKSPTTPRKTGS